MYLRPSGSPGRKYGMYVYKSVRSGNSVRTVYMGAYSSSGHSVESETASGFTSNATVNIPKPGVDISKAAPVPVRAGLSLSGQGGTVAGASLGRLGVKMGAGTGAVPRAGAERMGVPVVNETWAQRMTRGVSNVATGQPWSAWEKREGPQPGKPAPITNREISEFNILLQKTMKGDEAATGSFSKVVGRRLGDADLNAILAGMPRNELLKYAQRTIDTGGMGLTQKELERFKQLHTRAKSYDDLRLERREAGGTGIGAVVRKMSPAQEGRLLTLLESKRKLTITPEQTKELDSLLQKRTFQNWEREIEKAGIPIPTATIRPKEYKTKSLMPELPSYLEALEKFENTEREEEKKYQRGKMRKEQEEAERFERHMARTQQFFDSFGKDLRNYKEYAERVAAYKGGFQAPEPPTPEPEEEGRRRGGGGAGGGGGGAGEDVILERGADGGWRAQGQTQSQAQAFQQFLTSGGKSGPRPQPRQQRQYTTEDVEGMVGQGKSQMPKGHRSFIERLIDTAYIRGMRERGLSREETNAYVSQMDMARTTIRTLRQRLKTPQVTRQDLLKYSNLWGEYFNGVKSAAVVHIIDSEKSSINKRKSAYEGLKNLLNKHEADMSRLESKLLRKEDAKVRRETEAKIKETLRELRKSLPKTPRPFKPRAPKPPRPPRR